MAFGFADPFGGHMMPLSYRMMQTPQMPQVQAPQADPLAFIPKSAPVIQPVAAAAAPQSAPTQQAPAQPTKTSPAPATPGAPAVPGAAAGVPSGGLGGGSAWSSIFQAILGGL